MERILRMFREILQLIHDPRFFETERGYQGQLLTEINNYLANNEVWGDAPIAEQEYQKRARDHGLAIRPDIIIHVPFERGLHVRRSEGNYVVIEIKCKSSFAEAQKDFEKLGRMCNILDYPIGIFINIDSADTFLEYYDGEQCDCLYSFAVERAGDELVIHERGI